MSEQHKNEVSICNALNHTSLLQNNLKLHKWQDSSLMKYKRDVYYIMSPEHLMFIPSGVKIRTV